MANPYHDPKTGKFASKSGLNKENSTLTQRGKAKVKEHISEAKAFAIAGAAAVAGAAGAALLQGITKPIRARGHVFMHHALNAAEAHAQKAVATYGPPIAAAVKAKGSDLLNHVKNMRSAGAVQHAAATPVAKPRIRVPAGRQVVSSPKPVRRK